MGYRPATTCANSASAAAPTTMFLTAWPDRYSAPPVEIWTIPSLPASANPRSAAFRVWLEVTLIAGIREAALLGPVEHLGVDLWRRDRHGANSLGFNLTSG